MIIGKSTTPTYKQTNKNQTLERPDSKKDPEAVMDIKGESLKTGGWKETVAIEGKNTHTHIIRLYCFYADTLLDEAEIMEPRDDDIRLGDGNEEKDRIGEGREEDDVIMYDNEREIEKQLSKIKGDFYIFYHTREIA